MVITKLKNCCYKCNFPDIDVDSTYCPATIYKGKTIFDGFTDCVIYCKHAKVCKTYLESEK